MQIAPQEMRALFDPALHSDREVPLEDFLVWVRSEAEKMDGPVYIRVHVPDDADFTFALVHAATGAVSPSFPARQRFAV